MAPTSSSSATTTSVQVALRIRPPTAQDSTSIPVRFQRSVIQTTSTTSVSVETPSSALAVAGAPGSPTSGNSAPKKQQFTFDQVHPPPTTQYELFESTAKPMVTRFLEGFNCTILAYGQTSSGKTFTMTGTDLDADPSDPNNRIGIIPRAVATIFASAKQLKEERGGAWNFNVKGSFIELYNEDLIDLLSMDTGGGGRREVQIREDKDGHIIWDGLREVNVRSTGEVMNLIRKGTAIRRTNETDMNAQSSRSHAIFSLTLTQKKYTGTSPPPRSSSPLPPTGRSPSRLARPGSVYSGSPGNRVSSPTLGRPATPSFASAMNRGSLRPASALGHAGERSMNGDDDAGEWITIVSKFHFVDLAGSERLKRTAAVGERIKEGISINSGLLALGNVISALGDPARAKSHTATHIPYRDSKLTRLLQDSLGGNAHTLMIACVSPAEWNAGETINTLKYANRARNIKNRAVVNEKEDGWDDIEWLQTTVTRLRKELKSLKEGKIPAASEPDHEAAEGAVKGILARYDELQTNYEDLREKFVERTEELARLRRELGEEARSSNHGAMSGTAKYEEIVGPVIEEYEKAIATMEAELNLNRAALRHTNDLVEEKEEELNTLSSRHAATELYVEELRSRIAKLTEREASTEAYVRDLEEKIKAYDESSLTSNESMTDLKRELARFKDAEAYNAKYIAELEARLSKSDESILALQQTVERLEEDCEKRRNEVDALQSRLNALQKDGADWRADLEERERKVMELEQKMSEWESKKKEAGETRIRLGNVVEEVVSAKKSLENLTSSNASPQATPSGPSTPAAEYGTMPPVNKPDESLEKQLLALQQTHTATLADLSSVTAKYRDALKEISDLAAQIQEAKLSNLTITEVAESDATTESPVAERPEFPQFKRRTSNVRQRDGLELPLNTPGRRHFFRQAASAESLHLRSLSQSQSLSQELSSVHLRKASSSSHGTSSSHSPSSSHSHLSLHPSGSRVNLTPISTSTLNGNERTISSLEKEIMRLQDVLREREAEISVLEESLKKSQETGNRSIQPLMETQSTTPDGSSTNDLSPRTLNHFDHIKQSMKVNGHTENHNNTPNPDESLERLNELMLSMAQKESQHREIVDDLNAQLSQTQRQLDELTALSRDQALNMSKELEALQTKYTSGMGELRDSRSQLGQLAQRKDELEIALARSEELHKTEIEQLRVQHEEAMKAKGDEVESLLRKMREENESSLQPLHKQLEEVTATLQKARQEHEEAFGKLKDEYDIKLSKQLTEANEVLSSTQQEHQKAINKLLAEHAEALRLKDVEASTTSQTTEEEYYNALTKLRNDHAETIKKLTAEANSTVERLREEHAAGLRMAEITRQGSLSESESSRNLALKELQDEHAAAMARKEASFAEEVETLKAAHDRTLRSKDDEHKLQMDRLRLEYESSTLKLKECWRKEVDSLTSALEEEKGMAASALSNAVKESDTALENIKEQHAALLQELERGHLEDVERLKASHTSILKEVHSQAEQDLQALTQAHEEALTRLSQEHQQRVTSLEAELDNVRHQFTEELQSVLESSEQLVSEQASTVEQLKRAHLEDEQRLREVLQQEHAQERDKLRADLERRYNEEKKSLQKEHELVIQELEAHKAAAEEFEMLREQTRIKHEDAMTEKVNTMQEIQKQLTLVNTERDTVNAEVVKLREELYRTHKEQNKLVQEASKRESLVMELERHRFLIAELQENLQKVKDEKDNLQSERTRQDTLLRDLQAQIARSASPPNVRSPDRPIGFPRASGLPAQKLPPPTPPPSVPPPPAPRPITHVNGDTNVSTSSQGSISLTFTSSRDSQPESPSTSLAHVSTNGHAVVDPKLTVKLEQQAKQIEEQETMIKTLNKQLTHCESDLQAHMELVSTLETSLGDSEKNLRKARMQATELARERDTLNSRLEALRSELVEAKHEVATVRRSIVEEKQSLEQRLDEERRAKERVRQQLDLRTEELQKRKSKFACL